MEAAESACSLTHLPFLTPDEFERACTELQQAYDACFTTHGHGRSPLQVDLYANVRGRHPPHGIHAIWINRAYLSRRGLLLTGSPTHRQMEGGVG